MTAAVKKRGKRGVLGAVGLSLVLWGALAAQTPGAGGAGSFRPQSLAEFLTKSGILLDIRELTDIPLAFTVRVVRGHDPKTAAVSALSPDCGVSCTRRRS